MSSAEELKDKLEEAKEINLNLRFDNVEKQLTEIKEILKENSILYKGEIDSLKLRVGLLEEYQKHCPTISVKGVAVLTLYIIVIVTLVLTFSPGTMFEVLLKMKGL